MGYFEGIADGYFKTDKEGNKVFYPWGILGGKGYILPKDKEVNFHNKFKKYFQVSVPLTISGVIFFRGWFLLIIILPLYLVGYGIWMNRLTKGMKISNEKLTISESTTNSARSHNLPTLWFLIIGSSLFVLIGLCMIVTSPKDWIMGALSIAFFGFTGYLGLKMMKAKKQTRNTQHQNRGDR